MRFPRKGFELFVMCLIGFLFWFVAVSAVEYFLGFWGLVGFASGVCIALIFQLDRGSRG